MLKRGVQNPGRTAEPHLNAEKRREAKTLSASFKKKKKEKDIKTAPGKKNIYLG